MNSLSVTVNILYWHFYGALESTPSSISFKVYRSPKFVCVSACRFLWMHYTDTSKQTPVPIMGTSCLVFFVGLVSELHWVHSFHSITKSRGRRHGWEWKIGVLFYLGKKSRTRCSSFSPSLSLSLSCSWALCLEAKLKWVASTPCHITHYNDCCSDSVVPNQSHWTLVSSDSEVWESLLVSQSHVKSIWSHRGWDMRFSRRAAMWPACLWAHGGRGYSNSNTCCPFCRVVFSSCWQACVSKMSRIYGI